MCRCGYINEIPESWTDGTVVRNQKEAESVAYLKNDELRVIEEYQLYRRGEKICELKTSFVLEYAFVLSSIGRVVVDSTMTCSFDTFKIHIVYFL